MKTKVNEQTFVAFFSFNVNLYHVVLFHFFNLSLRFLHSNNYNIIICGAFSTVPVRVWLKQLHVKTASIMT